MKVYILTECFDNGAWYENDYQCSNRLVGCFSSRELAEEAAKKRIKKIYDSYDKEEHIIDDYRWYICDITRLEMSDDGFGFEVDFGDGNEGVVDCIISEVELDAEDI